MCRVSIWLVRYPGCVGRMFYFRKGSPAEVSIACGGQHWPTTSASAPAIDSWLASVLTGQVSADEIIAHDAVAVAAPLTSRVAPAVRARWGLSARMATNPPSVLETTPAVPELSARMVTESRF